MTEGWNQQEFDAIVPPIGNDNADDDITPFDLEYTPYCDLKIDTSRVALISGLVDSETVAAIYGEYGSSKTALVVHAALCLGQGKPFFGRKTKKIGVVIFAMEAPASTIKRLLAVADVPKDVPVFVVQIPFDITTAAGAGSIVNLVQKIREDRQCEIGLVVVDTLSRAVGADFEENDNGDMNALANVCAQVARDAKVAIILVHHEAKAKSGMRGGVALPNALDTVLHCFPAKSADKIFRASDKHEKGGKQRDLEQNTELRWTLEQIIFDKLDDDGNKITSVRVVELLGEEDDGETEVATTKPLQGRTAIALDALKKAIANDGSVLAPSRLVPGGTRGLSRSLWRRYFDQLSPADAGTKPDAQKRAFNRALEYLQNHDFIGVSGDDVWLVGQVGQVGQIGT